ncbi:MAG: phospho-N-acetylmuramoyl-pentapeptide-transferase [Culicoidibacterales bacterium]
MLGNIWFNLLLHTFITFIITVGIGAVGLPFLRKIKAGQFVREEGPASHIVKSGTPTMGGWFFIIAILVVSLASNAILGGTPESIWFYVVALLMYASIGFIDDFLKVVMKRNLGLTSWQKLFLQVIMVFVLFVVFRSHFADSTINLLIFQLKVPMLFYILFAIVWFVGFSNATNVTDGLDGLLTTCAAIVFFVFGVIAMLKNSGGTAVFCFIGLGAMIGFFVFNRFPAKVFMGDTGSLALGALFAAISIELELEFILLLVGIVFVVETLSVMIQVIYFKWTKRQTGAGKRIFLMSPLHHHLELKGDDEVTVVNKFTILGLIGGIIAICIVFFS